MKALEIKLNANGVPLLPKGRVNVKKLDGFSDADLNAQAAQDDALVMQDAALYAKKTRMRLGLTQQQFAHFTEIPIDSIRNWEQGKRSPTGAAKTLFKIFNRAPEMALGTLR